MSEKTRKIETETTKDALDTFVSKNLKKKHNSKRRCKKNKAVVETKNDPRSSKVDEVVNYLCSTVLENEPKTFLENSLSNKPVKYSQKISGFCAAQNSSQNLKFNSSSMSSTKDLNSLFKNLQVNTLKDPFKSNKIDFLTSDLLKKTKQDSVKLTERLKQENFDKNPNLNEEKISIPNKGLEDYFSLNVLQNSSRASAFGLIDSNCVQLFSEVKQSVYSNSSDVNNRLQKRKEHYDINDLIINKNNLVTSVSSTSKLLVEELEKSLHSGFKESSKKCQKKKSGSKKSDKKFDDNEFMNCNQRVFFNSDLQKTCCNKPALLESSQENKSQKKQQTSKSSVVKNDTKFPTYLTVEELQSLTNFGVLLTGVIRINKKNYKEAYITAPDKGMDILIEGLRDRNRALEGDEVYFVLKAKEHHKVSNDSTDVQRTGVVVGIKTFIHDRKAVGTLNVIKNKSNSFTLLSPRDSRIPRIRIQKSNWPKGFSENSDAFKNKLYYAKISQWDDLRYANGEIIKEVGEAGDLEAETDAILLSFGLNIVPYEENFKRFLPDVNLKISELDFRNREDFRKDCVFTIDPKTTVDIDDAVSCKLLPNGNYEVGVHISDVSFFLEERTPLDQAVCERATTIYLVQKTFHMLPFELCRLCSLTPGEDKLSFSVIWEITQDFKIMKSRFTRSVINSCAQLSYDQVQAVIDNLSTDLIFPKIYGGHTIENIKEIILLMHKLAVHLRNERFTNGALRIDQKKICFSLDENKLPVNFREEIHGPSHQLIEEFMLLANVTVAEKLICSFPKLAFLRCHPPPLSCVLKKLQKTLEKYGILLDISSSHSIQTSLSKYSGNDTESIARTLVLNNALTKPMARAKYYCGGLFPKKADRRHYALCVPLYTHFTSPIRRYADVMVHRLVAASLRYCDPPKWAVEEVQEIASNCNKQKYAAKMAQEMSTELYLALYIGQQGSMVCEAVVCDIKDKSFDCIGLSTGIHQRLYFENILGDVKHKKEDGILSLIVKWPKDENHVTETIQIIKMFSVVKIELKRSSVFKIKAELLRQQ